MTDIVAKGGCALEREARRQRQTLWRGTGVLVEHPDRPHTLFSNAWFRGLTPAPRCLPCPLCTTAGPGAPRHAWSGRCRAAAGSVPPCYQVPGACAGDQQGHGRVHRWVWRGLFGSVLGGMCVWGRSQAGWAELGWQAVCGSATWSRFVASCWCCVLPAGLQFVAVLVLSCAVLCCWGRCCWWCCR